MKKEATGELGGGFDEELGTKYVEDLKKIAFDRSKAYALKEECISRIKIYVKAAYANFMAHEDPRDQETALLMIKEGLNESFLLYPWFENEEEEEIYHPSYYLPKTIWQPASTKQPPRPKGPYCH